MQVPRTSQNQSGGKTAPRGEGEKDCVQLRWISSSIVFMMQLHQHEGRDGAGGEKELTEEGTIAAFNGASFLNVNFHYKKAQSV